MMATGLLPRGQALSVVCNGCTKVARVPLPLPASAAPWTCPSCGTRNPLLSGTLSDAALRSLADDAPPAPVFSENFHRPGPPGTAVR